MIAPCYEIHAEHVNAPCEQNLEFFNVKPGDKYSIFCALLGQTNDRLFVARGRK
jgi:hypothetical protein